MRLSLSNLAGSRALPLESLLVGLESGISTSLYSDAEHEHLEEGIMRGQGRGMPRKPRLTSYATRGSYGSRRKPSDSAGTLPQSSKRHWDIA